MNETIWKNFERKRSIRPTNGQNGHLVGSSKGYLYICLAVMTVILLAMPSLADDSGSRYMAGNPELTAHISGTNEFSPGDDLNVPVAIENSGTNQFKIVKSSIIDPGDLSNTAKQLQRKSRFRRCAPSGQVGSAAGRRSSREFGSNGNIPHHRQSGRPGGYIQPAGNAELHVSLRRQPVRDRYALVYV